MWKQAAVIFEVIPEHNATGKCSTCASSLQEHEKTKKEIVDTLKAEVSDLKKELQQRKKLVAMQQQIIQHGSETYNKVVY